METESYPEEKVDLSVDDNWAAPTVLTNIQYDLDEIGEIQESLGGSASKDVLMSVALVMAVGDQNAKDQVTSLWKKHQAKMGANLEEMMKRQEAGTESIRASRGKRSLENESSS